MGTVRERKSYSDQIARQMSQMSLQERQRIRVMRQTTLMRFGFQRVTTRDEARMEEDNSCRTTSSHTNERQRGL
ncbi:hypothetical protein AAMO2058_000417200 [Amorphochlora amoebiformis]|eukprot:1395353-Amorphochlora_amoeboformis.AAC.4